MTRISLREIQDIQERHGLGKKDEKCRCKCSALIYDDQTECENCELKSLRKRCQPMITPPLRDEFEARTKPIIEWLNENCHPHVCAVITPTSAELFSGETAFTTEAYLRD